MDEQIMPAKPETATVVDIQFRPGQKVYFFDPAGLQLQAGDHVVIDTARGAEFGYCTAGNHNVPMRDVVAPLRPVLRRATEQDEKIASTRKSQVGSGDRSEKIRTYNFPQSRVTDHRINKTLFSLGSFLNGDIDSLITDLIAYDTAERLKGEG